MTPRFERFAAIDWSGAKGERHKGIAIALCGTGDAAPVLVRPDHVWSRMEVLDWLRAPARRGAFAREGRFARVAGVAGANDGRRD